MENCLFCKIIRGDIPAQKVFENDSVLAFKDLHPQALIHILFIHKNHTKDVNELSQSSSAIAEVFTAIREWTQKEKLDEKGFRVVTNLGRDSGQTVFHTHFHVLAGETLGSFGR